MSLDRNIPPEFAAQTLSQFAIVSMKPMVGGLSGARVWRCHSNLHGPLCLRQWPSTHPTPSRLQFIHQALEHANQQLPYIPKLFRDAVGKSFWEVGECLWEITQWMPGQADYLRQPSRVKLAAAVNALAEVHRVWHDLSHTPDVSPSVAQRMEMLSGWLAKRNLVEQIGAGLRGPVESAACMSTVRMLHARGPQLLDELQVASGVKVMLHPVLRDIWSDHVLFHGELVSGIIDFGTVRMDEPAADLARMLGSLHPFEEDVRLGAVEAYNRQRPLHEVVPARVELLDRSGTLLTALQWMQWLVLERRKFNVEPRRLLERWQTALSRMMGESLFIGVGPC